MYRNFPSLNIISGYQSASLCLILRRLRSIVLYEGGSNQWANARVEPAPSTRKVSQEIV